MGDLFRVQQEKPDGPNKESHNPTDYRPYQHFSDISHTISYKGAYYKS